MKVYFINTVNKYSTSLLPGTYVTREEAEKERDRLEATGMLMEGSQLEIEEYEEGQ